jgi:hypothetical protein
MKSNHATETVSTVGPVCPECGEIWPLDEAHYYDEKGYALSCDQCGTAFAVEPAASWSWTSRKLEGS